MKNILILFLFLLLACQETAVYAQEWYTQGVFHPRERIELTVINDLDIHRSDVPVVISRDQLPVYDFHELDVTLVDPMLEPRPEPTPERLARYGYHEIRAESNGRMIFHQLDDLNRDGLWDELFFITDLKPREHKTIYLYIGHNDRGWNPHTTTAGIGSYSRHLMPYWENEYVGWKLWYSTDVDVFGKREPQLMSHFMVQNNYDGYGVPYDMGSDIMAVGNTLGGGGIVLFEDEENPAKVSRPRFTPAREASGSQALYNVGPFGDTRYSYEVIVNGPLRSKVKVRTMNWFTGQGSYELEQVYTAYTRQNYSTVRVQFTRFQTAGRNVLPGAGIRKHPNEEFFRQHDQFVVTGGAEEIINPDDIDGIQQLMVDYIIHALVVPQRYQPQFQFVEDYNGNYTFRVSPDRDLGFEYMIASAWSEGPPFETMDDFYHYMRQTVQEYEHPARVEVSELQTRPF